MTLEFQKLTQQIEELGTYMAGQEIELSEKVDLALTIWRECASQDALESIQARVRDVIDRDLGYRGATPFDEPIMDVFPPAPLPASATIIAADGSQIAPNPHEPVLYYLLNIGTILFRHGSGDLPQINSQPWLYYDSQYLHTDQGLISSETVDVRRTAAELVVLANTSETARAYERPLTALVDGPLLFVIKSGIPDRDEQRALYFDAMRRLRSVSAGLAGYIDRPRSSFIINLLHLLSLPSDKVTEKALKNSGRLEGLQDIQVLRSSLPSGYRSAIFVQMSPINKEFKDVGGDDLEIAFFYLNVAYHGESPALARVEVPMWVARDRQLVSEIQALLVEQCKQTGLRYPYVLTRADELAVVRREEAKQLDVLIQVAMTRQGVFKTSSEKQSGKVAARAGKSRLK